MKKLITLLIVALSLVAGFLCGYFLPRKVYVDLTDGWWLVGVSDDRHKLLSRGNITVKTHETIDYLRWADYSDYEIEQGDCK